MRVSFHTSHIHIREVEWCARLHQRTHNQDWEVYRGTVRVIAKEFGVSKSTVHKDLTERLPEINPDLANEVKEILDYHKSIRHLRGGEATKLKYKKDELLEEQPVK
jgi:putative DeoR family transcriptional regulator, stage III sporulation protein D